MCFCAGVDLECTCKVKKYEKITTFFNYINE